MGVSAPPGTRPTRICFVSSGSEFGWRPGTDKWSPSWPDNLPAVLNIGQGSPTNLLSCRDASFPEKYRKALFAFDWSFGIIYAIHLQPDGAGYKAEAEEFLSGAPLPLTDGVIGPDGAMYFLTGGRRLESDLYRVYYDDGEKMTAKEEAPVINEAHQLRRQLESYHGRAKAGAVEAAWPQLKHADRFVRYAARTVLENQPLNSWQARALAEKDPETIIQATIALARRGDSTLRSSLLQQLQTVNYVQLSASQQVDLLRAVELVLARMGMPEDAVKQSTIAYLNAHFPAATNELNSPLSKLLVYLGAPDAVQKTVALMKTAKDDTTAMKTAMSSADLIMRNPQYGLDIAGMLSKMPPLQQTFYATVLSEAKTGWTPELQESYFSWFHGAFGFKGGHSFLGFVNNARKNALKSVPKSEYAHFNAISGDSLVNNSGRTALATAQPKGPGRRWKLEEAVLGALMLEKGAFDTVIEILKAECFYVDAHQKIFAAMQGLAAKSMPVDILTVVEELKSSGDLEAVGGPFFVSRLTNMVVSSANIEAHARIVLQKFIQRELIRISGEIISEAYEDTADVFDLLDAAESKLFEVTNNHLRKNYDSIDRILVNTIKRIEDLRNKGDDITGVPSGFPTLDKITYGWQPSDLIILAARPAVGKTAFALNLVRNAALHPKFPKGAAVFSLGDVERPDRSAYFVRRVGNQTRKNHQGQAGRVRNAEADDPWYRKTGESAYIYRRYPGPQHLRIACESPPPCA